MTRASATRLAFPSSALILAGKAGTHDAARFSVVAAAVLAVVGAAFGLLVGAPTGAITGFGVWLVVACLVFSVVVVVLVSVWPLRRLAPIATTATVFYGAYLGALAVFSVVDPGSRASLFVGLIWFTPLQAFNRIVNRGRAADILAWFLLVLPLSIVVLMSPWIMKVFPPPLVTAGIGCVLANITSALMINVLWRYREAFMSERELSASFRLASEILESISESFVLVDRAYGVLYLNRSACEALGVSRADAEGKPLAQIGVSLASPAVTDALEAAWTGDGPHRFEVETAGRWYEFRSTPRASDMAILFQDITEKRATQDAVRAGERRLAEQAEFLDKATDAIMVREIGGRVTYLNQSAARLFGVTSQEVIGRPIHEVLNIDRALSDETTAKVLMAGELRRVADLAGADGGRIVLDSHLTLIRDEAGRPKSILTINTDITARIAIEDRLRRTERLEAVGQLTGGVAHDFNNLLTVILGNAETLNEELPDRTDLLNLSEMIARAAARGAALTHQLLAFAQQQTLDPRPIDPQALLSDMSALLRRTLREDIAMAVPDNPGVWRVLVDPTQLENALLNLCLNARDAMPRGGTLTIETENVVLDDDYADRNLEVSPGDYVRITVTDDGNGISPENLQRVFDPFFTTKEFGKGTGLGLSMVYGFIRQSHGHINIYSEPGHGTSVKMFLPRAVEEATSPDPASLQPVELEGSETILVVEDDDLLRANVERQLKSLGYRVITSANGLEALEAIRSGASVDLLFTDVIMPGGLNGPALARAARELLPNLRLLYTSGYTENAIVHQGRLDPGIQLLAKPYVRADLALKVRAVLAAPL